MIKHISLVLIFLGLLMSGCANKDFRMFEEDSQSESGDSEAVKTVSDEEYQQELEYEWKIVKGDRVEIAVFNQSSASGGGQLESIIDTSRQTQFNNRDGTEGLLIPTNGKIHLPMLGHIKLAGLTEIEAGDKLTDEYKKFLRNPYVVVKIQNQRLFVLGEVNRPGVVQVTAGNMTIFEALAQSGDVTDDAMRTNIRIIRGDLRNPTMREVDLTDMGAMRVSSLMLRPNDIVYVQPRSMKAYNKAFDEQVPFFNMINTMLAPFVSITYIKDGYKIHW
ncbi:MAG: polysaccharide biosynthesis/export family protein [Campylobacterota bacterium]|nr:polysaccharide biosynthesis/export family protein [Campylobacterota bacterium]